MTVLPTVAYGCDRCAVDDGLLICTELCDDAARALTAAEAAELIAAADAFAARLGQRDRITAAEPVRVSGDYL
jgi:hypothetical protein